MWTYAYQAFEYKSGICIAAWRYPGARLFAVDLQLQWANELFDSLSSLCPTSARWIKPGN